MRTSTPNLRRLAERAASSYFSRWGQHPTRIVAAPGRVNLIGEHIDYHGGMVYPFAIDRHVVLAARPGEMDRTDGLGEIENLTTRQVVELTEDLPSRDGFAWTRFVVGVIREYRALGILLPAWRATLDADLPAGGGLSSSAALTVATAMMLEGLTGVTLGAEAMGLACQSAEHWAVGVPCGIMDPFASILGRAGHIVRIDCRTRTANPLPFALSRHVLLLSNTGVRHVLAAGEFARRLEVCQSALRKLGASSFLDVNLEAHGSRPFDMNDEEWRATRHVLSELQRAQRATDWIASGDWPALGAAMYASHDSLRDDYGVSCPELDTLVETAGRLGSSAGVLGSRMTGGGFGGCVLSLVEATRVQEICDALDRDFVRSFERPPTHEVVAPADGARLLRMD